MIIIKPTIVQSIGLTCIPQTSVAGHPPKWLTEIPVAAAVLTVHRHDDERCEISAQTMSDVHSQEYPLTWLIDQALIPGAVTLIQPEDRNILRIAAAGRRFFAEPRLARLLLEPERMVDPCATWDGERPDFRLLAKSLAIPTLENSASSNQKLWDRRLNAPLEERALGDAVSRLLIWSTFAAFENVAPGLFFEPTLALHRWLGSQPEKSALKDWQMSRPVMRAISFEHEYRADAARHASGEPRSWPQFRDGLFHT